eukprot:CAMPEP_0197641144 /NCGR_PEP_ID=MMETSP1338-20131121/15191_1 /TAXON_ID=43686 ORGANISM="Pelagodinium beii, Strain RCC1491" /NCGR_SAMPLE_ID=MMETSP1338 /ASSEMBLY_ACC=CAM_ASM_000754 /LENGTH=343 /DNA_ID=CAMNT_0043214069 /DNA_START=46 /DNA_END=1074 /DNA_ORIENTATION=-
MASQMKSANECRQWMAHVHEAQMRRTPEGVQAARQRIEAARQYEISSRKCKAAKSHAVRSRALAAEGLRQMSCVAASAPEQHMEVQQRWRSAQAASSKRQVSAMAKADLALSASSAAAVLTEEEDEEDEAMAEAAELVGGDARSMALLGSEGLAAPRSGAVEELLKQLRQEPGDEAECSAKFMLFEGYSAEVEQMRGTLMKFHEETVAKVPGNVAADMKKQVKSIDSVEAMGIPDDAREWFVYHMMRKAERNNLKMAGILENFEKRLEFLASNDQAECPICLEAFQAQGAHSSETLSCCHKVCKDCWETWSSVTRGRPFCPLCRNEDFLGVITEHKVCKDCWE